MSDGVSRHLDHGDFWPLGYFQRGHLEPMTHRECIYCIQQAGVIGIGLSACLCDPVRMETAARSE